MPRRARQPAPARLLLVRAIAVGAALAATPARGAELQDPFDVQAAMLVNVVKFVTWPGSTTPDRAMRVCAVAAPRFASALAKLASRGARIAVVELRSPARASGCDVVILGGALEDELDEAAEQLGAAGALTVSDSPGAARRGVHVAFVLHGDRVRFEVNLAAARRDRFEISSKLLRLAQVVGGGSS
jgi:hypothetical protein